MSTSKAREIFTVQSYGRIEKVAKRTSVSVEELLAQSDRIHQVGYAHTPRGARNVPLDLRNGQTYVLRYHE